MWWRLSSQAKLGVHDLDSLDTGKHVTDFQFLVKYFRKMWGWLHIARNGCAQLRNGAAKRSLSSWCPIASSVVLLPMEWISSLRQQNAKARKWPATSCAFPILCMFLTNLTVSQHPRISDPGAADHGSRMTLVSEFAPGSHTLPIASYLSVLR